MSHDLLITPARRANVTVTVALAVAMVFGGPATWSPAAATDPLEALLLQSFPATMTAPLVSLTALDGRSFTLAELRGKVVFLNFWATWCIPCRQEMPALDNLYRTYRDRGFVVLAVNFKESARDVRSFVDQTGVTFPTVLDPEGAVSRALKVRGLPVSFLVGRDGTLQWKAIGSRDWDGPDGRAYLDELLRPPRS